MAKQRLPYIDLMKGLCIMLIVMHHTDDAFFDAVAPGLDNALQSFRVPMYYFLSGLFFKHYSGPAEFLRRKVNNLVVPFLFFHLAGFAVAAAMFPWLHPGAHFPWREILGPLHQRQWVYTIPLWFLMSLFEVNVLYYAISRAVPRWPWRIAVVAALSVVPLWLASRHTVLPLMLDTALVGLAFFTLGHAAGSAGLLKPHRADRWGPAVFPLVAAVVWGTAARINIVGPELPSWPQLYLVPSAAILTLLWAAKNVTRRVPVVGVWGQYSLIVLGTHDWLLTPLDTLLAPLPLPAPWLALLKWGITMAAMLAIIPAMVRVFPRFTAQKPLIAPRQ